MTLFEALLVLATFLCSMVAGFVFAFAVVIMPGIKRLDDGGFIRAFQVIDGVIQNGQPLFMLMWVGSALAVIAAAVFGFWELAGANRLLLFTAALIYVLGVQAPTAAVNIPLNNALQKLDPAATNEAGRARARADFESRWNRWNTIRTVWACVTSLMLLMLLFKV